jgi:hypothetical protein
MILSHLSEPGDAWLLQCPRSDPIRSELAKIFGVNAMRCEFLGKETAKILRLLDDAGIPARMSMSAHSERKSFRQKPRGQLYLANQALILPIHESSDGIAGKQGERS